MECHIYRHFRTTARKPCFVGMRGEACRGHCTELYEIQTRVIELYCATEAAISVPVYTSVFNGLNPCGGYQYCLLPSRESTHGVAKTVFLG